jgi:hypothetical protein
MAFILKTKISFKRQTIIVAMVYGINMLLGTIYSPGINALFLHKGTIPFNAFYWLGDASFFMADASLLLIPVFLIYANIRRGFLKIIFALVLLYIIPLILSTFIAPALGGGLGFNEHIQTTYQNHVYKVVSLGEFFVYQQYSVYRCDEVGAFCHRVLDPYRADSPHGLCSMCCDDSVYEFRFAADDEKLVLYLNTICLDGTFTNNDMVFIIPTE